MLQIAPPPEPIPAVMDEAEGPFRFEQLSKEAKEHARDHYREHGLDDEWWDNIYADAHTIAAMLGINIYASQGRSEIYFTGFWSQGDGACFAGTGARPTHDVVAEVTKQAPNDERLAAIAETYAHLAARSKSHNVNVTVRPDGRYSHSRSTMVDVEYDWPDAADAWNDFQRMTYEAVRNHTLGDNFAVDITEALRSFMDWIYVQLEQEYEYLTSDEHIDQALADDMFDEDGDLA